MPGRWDGELNTNVRSLHHEDKIVLGGGVKPVTCRCTVLDSTLWSLASPTCDVV